MSTDARTIHPFSDETPAMDEPIRETVRRDVMHIGEKFAYVCNPGLWKNDCGPLRQWDLWGPLLLCVVVSLGCWLKSVDDERRALFAFLFGFYWIGSFVVVLNMSLIGGSSSYLQGMGVLGYTSFPLMCSCIMALLIPEILGALKLLAVVGGGYMSTKASVMYIQSSVAPEKFYLAIYPLILFYAVIGWIVSVI